MKRNIFLRDNNLVLGEIALTTELNHQILFSFAREDIYPAYYWPPEYLNSKTSEYSFDIW